MGVNLLSLAARKSLTNDEIVHIPAGYFYLSERDFGLNNEHPPLVKIWAALPLVFMNLSQPPPEHDSSQNSESRTIPAAMAFWQANRSKFESIVFWSRVPMIILTVGLGALIFIYARKTFGARAAVLSIILFATEPTILAHGWIVHTDVAGALTYFSFFLALYAYARTLTFQRALLLGMATGLALATKFSNILLAPTLIISLLFLILRAPRRHVQRSKSLISSGAAVLITLLVVNGAYSFRHPLLRYSDAQWAALKSPRYFGELTATFRILRRIAPTDFLFGLYRVAVHNHYGHSASLLGQHSLTGWWYYFPVAFALKTTLPFLIVSVAGLGWGLSRLFARKEKLFLALIIPIALYAAVAISSNVNIGIRHILPVFPFLFIIAGAFLSRIMTMPNRRALMTMALVLTLSWMCFEAVRAWPDYLSYMNELTWRHPRWYYLSDSNVEWGEDIRDLAEYLKTQGETEVRTTLLGSATLEFYGVKNIGLPAAPGEQLPATRYVAIGASFLNGSTVPSEIRDTNGRLVSEEERVNLFANYRDRTPEKVFGNSIYLYRERE